MNTRNIRVLALIAVLLQALAVVAGSGIVIFQKTLVPLLVTGPMESHVTAFPAMLVFMILDLIIYIFFFSVSSKEGEKVTVIILIVLSILFSFLSVFADRVIVYLYAAQGAEGVAIYSGVSSLVSFASLLGIPAAPLFYIACGQYTANPREEKCLNDY